MLGFIKDAVFGGSKSVVEVVTDTIDEFIETDEDRREDRKRREDIELLREQLQMKINLEDAKSDKWWKSGARPAWLWTALVVAVWFTLGSSFGLVLPPAEIIDFWFWIALSLLGIRQIDKSARNFTPAQNTKIDQLNKRIKELEKQLKETEIELRDERKNNKH